MHPKHVGSDKGGLSPLWSQEQNGAKSCLRRLSVVARGYTKMAIVGGVPALRVAILAMPATLQSQMPQKVVVRSQDGTEPSEHVDLRVKLALANEALDDCPWGAVSGHHLLYGILA